MPLSDLRPLAKQAMEHRGTMMDVVLAVLRDAILTGVLPEGEELNQVQLATQFGISRVPVREALRRLEAEGLVVSRAHKRTVVSSLGLRRIEELMEIRVALESLATRQAVPNISESDLETINDLLTRMEAEPDMLRWLEMNREFHQRVYRRSGREVLCTMADQVRYNIERYLWAHGVSTGRRLAAEAEHRAILAACSRGDPEQAAVEVSRHLMGTMASIRRRLRPSG